MTLKIKFLRSKNADEDEDKLRRGQTSSSDLRKKFLDFFEKRRHPEAILSGCYGAGKIAL